MRGLALACLLAVVVACSSSSGGDGGVQCPAGSDVCGSVCANLQGDPQNCGKCGIVCPHGQICDLGACTTGISDAARESTTTDAPADTTPDSPSDSPSDSGTSEAATD